MLMCGSLPRWSMALPPLTTVALELEQVEFENLTYTTEVPEREATIPTVGSSFLNVARSNPTRTHAVLQSCSGVLAPGTLTLVCVGGAVLPNSANWPFCTTIIRTHISSPSQSSCVQRCPQLCSELLRCATCSLLGPECCCAVYLLFLVLPHWHRSCWRLPSTASHPS